MSYITQKNKVYLQEAVDGRYRAQQDEEEKSIQSHAGQHEQPLWKSKRNMSHNNS